MTSARAKPTSTSTTRAFERRIDSFAMEVQAARARVLRMTSAPGVSGEEDALRRAREELQVEQEELRVAEEELREQIDELARVSERATIDRERYRQLFDDSLDALLVTDASGVIREANAVAARAFGVDAHVLRGRPLPGFVSSRDRDEIRTLVNAASTLGRGQYVDATIGFEPRGAPAFEAPVRGGPSSSEGRLLWSLRLPASEHDARRASGMRRKFESHAEVERAHADARELLERERAIRDRFERAARAKERFLSVLSHDLRGPLNAVLGWTQLMLRESLSPVSREHALATIERNARVQLALIEEILDISRLTEDKMTLEFETVDVRTVVERVVESTSPTAAAKGIALVLEAVEPAVTIADARRLGQVFTNLLGNAVKFTGPGGRITVGVSSTAREIEVFVRDTGRGIAPDVLPHVFERYRQHEPATQGGLGLGLYIVHELVELHGGSVEAASAGIDTGATFTVRLPRRAVDAPPSTRQASSTAAPPRLDHCGSSSSTTTPTRETCSPPSSSRTARPWGPPTTRRARSRSWRRSVRTSS